MSFIYKISLSASILLTTGILSLSLFDSGDSFGGDFLPPKPTVSSHHISNVFSDLEEFEVVDHNVNRFLKRNNLAGASLAIAKDGKLVFAKGYGFADKERSINVQPYNLFRIASVSKLITAVAVMKLVEANKLTLESTVFGPDGILNDSIFLDYRDPKVETITVRELLNHSAGWTNRWGDPMFMPNVISKKLGVDYPIESEDIIRFMLQKRLHYAPGTMSSYSNFGYTVLEQVIEKASGMDYEMYVKTNVLYPLEIFDMQIGRSYPWERLDLEVKYYEPQDDFFVPDHLNADKQALRSYGGNDIHTLGAAGGWVSSTTDLLRLVVAIDGFDNPNDLLSKESIKEMVSKELVGGSPLGWRGVREGKYWYRTGTLAGTSALVMRKENGISYAIVFNSSSWKGPVFANDIKYMMDHTLDKIEEWPSYDLFKLKNNDKPQRRKTIF
ncbi:serine hydrolase domain-containing protein [Plebeiibacterium sediminum]|uniref:Beta-lactamase family protein n=1 Tax=Plebeiibacterium sediminum TaxID=2992112 RepID=A0AAE3M6I3_9BACT|nr:serine hydrolase domain-containing protein [Plebeiobacterium sediminum]MCW3787857.1 beta-lactamase family protein [Plebeiobacterium sediminum]